MSRIIRISVSLIMSVLLVMSLASVAFAENTNMFNARFGNGETEQDGIVIVCSESDALSDTTKQKIAERFLEILKSSETDYENEDDRAYSENATVDDLMTNSDWIEVGILSFGKDGLPVETDTNAVIKLDPDDFKQGYYTIIELWLYDLNEDEIIDFTFVEDPEDDEKGIYTVETKMRSCYVIFTYLYVPKSNPNPGPEPEPRPIPEHDGYEIFIPCAKDEEDNPDTGAEVIDLNIGQLPLRWYLEERFKCLQF